MAIKEIVMKLSPTEVLRLTRTLPLLTNLNKGTRIP
jgi:hypothetical protein